MLSPYSGTSIYRNARIVDPSRAIDEIGTVFVADGKIVAAAQEERFSRKKHDYAFPQLALDFCLERAGISVEDVDLVTFYDKPLLKFDRLLRDKVKVVEMDQTLTKRSVNEGFSGGEKKRNEVFQMAVLEPKLRLLDELDSGLDIDALKIVSDGINALPKFKHQARGGQYRKLVVITFNRKVHLLDFGASNVIYATLNHGHKTYF